MEQKRRDWGKAAAVLCVLLLGLNLWQGKRLEELEHRISDAQIAIMDDIRSMESAVPPS